MTDALLAGDKIIMRGFGAFTLKVQRDRIGHNPQTNRPIQITGKRLIAFKPGRALFALLNPEI